MLWNVHCVPTVVLSKQLNFKSVVIRSNRSSCLFNKRSPKDAAWKTELFAFVISRERRAPQPKKIQSNVSQIQRSLHAKIQLFLNTFKMAEKSRGRSCTRPFNCSFIHLKITYSYAHDYLKI